MIASFLEGKAKSNLSPDNLGEVDANIGSQNFGEVDFSQESGAIGGSFNLTLSGNNSGEVIHYALGGEEPTESSPIYTQPIEISENTSVRARIFLDNYFHKILPI